jgi:DNA polymerase-3 subunit alpha
MNALYRPGPMDYIPSFIARKHGREEITYDIPEMERYLKDTYGITVYQEQVMLLSRQLAGFTRGESDALRKAMGKKLIDKMKEMKEKFLTGGKASGHEEKTLNKIWSDWEKFASYAFNKSHATCYSWVAYQTAYLKANYPSEYMAAVLSRSLSNITEITKFMDECKAMGIQVLGPDVNESIMKFSVNKAGDIRFGLGAVKGVGESAVINIIEERQRNGAFRDIFDFVERISLTACNKKSFEAMALAGAFDNLDIHREQFFSDGGRGEVFLETLMRYGNKYQTDKASSANSLFGDEDFAVISKPEIPPYERWNDLERLNKEKELIGIYLSAHPLDEYRIILTHVCNTGVADLNELDSLQGRELLVGGIVIEVREGMTKKGNPYGVMKIEDFSGNAEIALFGNEYVDYSKYFKVGMYLLIRARVESHRWKEGEVDLRISSIRLLQEEKDNMIEKINITIPVSVLDEPTISELSVLIKNNPGQSLLYFKVTDGERNLALNLFSQNIRLNITQKLIDFLDGHESIEFKIN